MELGEQDDSGAKLDPQWSGQPALQQAGSATTRSAQHVSFGWHNPKLQQSGQTTIAAIKIKTNARSSTKHLQPLSNILAAGSVMGKSTRDHHQQSGPCQSQTTTAPLLDERC